MNNTQPDTCLSEQIHRICNAIAITDQSTAPAGLSFNGVPVVPGSHDAFSTLEELEKQDPTVLALRTILYQQCYAYPFNNKENAGVDTQPTDSEKAKSHTQYSPQHASEQLLQRENASMADDVTPYLSAANHGRTHWDSDWVVEAISENGQFHVVKNKQRLKIWPGEFVCAQGVGQPAVVGAQVNLYRPCEAAHWQPGFYYAFSDNHYDQFEHGALVRFYWNVRVAEATSLTSAITREFNRYQMPFRFKCTNLISLSERVDTAVLYLPSQYLRLGRQLVLEIHDSVNLTLDDEVPLFSKPLAKGLSMAQDPDNGSSFGMERCLRLARAIVHCVVKQGHTSQTLGNQVLEYLQFEGLDLAMPHITPYSRNNFINGRPETSHE